MKISVVLAFAFAALSVFECCVSGTSLMIFEDIAWISWRIEGGSVVANRLEKGGATEKDFE